MVPTPPASRPPHDDRKARLFCECGRSDPLDDWPVCERTNDDDVREVVACPNCGRVVVSQPVLAVPA